MCDHWSLYSVNLMFSVYDWTEIYLKSLNTNSSRFFQGTLCLLRQTFNALAVSFLNFHFLIFHSLMWEIRLFLGIFWVYTQICICALPFQFWGKFQSYSKQPMDLSFLYSPFMFLISLSIAITASGNDSVKNFHLIFWQLRR